MILTLTITTTWLLIRFNLYKKASVDSLSKQTKCIMEPSFHGHTHEIMENMAILHNITTIKRRQEKEKRQKIKLG